MRKLLSPLSLLLVSLVSLSALSVASAQSWAQKYDTGFSKRADFILSEYDTSKSLDYFGCAVKYARHLDLKTANRDALRLLKHPTGDMFWMIEVMNMYLHGKDDMSQSVKEAIRNAWKTYTPYRGDTENHWVQYHTALFLASEQWPNLPGSDWYNGRSSKVNLEDAKSFLLAWMKETTTIGTGEFDSPDYYPVYVNPMLLLAEYSKDPEMKQMGKMMVDYLLAEFAAENLQGQFVGGYSRIYQPAVYEPSRSNFYPYAHLYFDVGRPERSGLATIAALSSYRLPRIIYEIAHDRSKPYVHTEIKRVRNILRYGKDRTPKVFKYDYIAHDYAVSSIQGGFLQPIQQHTWGLFFTHGFPYTTVFSIEPYWSGWELARFFPEERQTLVGAVTSSNKGTYNKPNKWTGSSPYERTFQHKNTLIVLYDIAPGTNTEYIDGFFPNTLDTLIKDYHGWIAGRAGTAYFGWYPLQPQVWMNKGFYTELRSHHPQNGLVLEARDKSQVGSFEHFLTLLKTHRPQADLNPKHVSVNYRTLDGMEMHFVFPNVRDLNGKKVNMMNYRYYKGPFLNSAYKSQVETITCKGMRMVLDFKSLKISGNGE